ncbi:MAG: trypsin-like peptidase domain-containing protein [Aeriscardovia aeriphila]|nr:trypsin-like peptidase domain-containing protein [Aeriscardovia aeriphila]
MTDQNLNGHTPDFLNPENSSQQPLTNTSDNQETLPLATSNEVDSSQQNASAQQESVASQESLSAQENASAQQSASSSQSTASSSENASEADTRQSGDNPTEYGQNSSAQYGQNAYGQSYGQYGQNSQTGQTSQNSPAGYSSNPYAGNSYGHNAYGQNAYGQNNYGQSSGYTNGYGNTYGNGYGYGYNGYNAGYNASSNANPYAPGAGNSSTNSSSDASTSATGETKTNGATNARNSSNTNGSANSNPYVSNPMLNNAGSMPVATKKKSGMPQWGVALLSAGLAAALAASLVWGGIASGFITVPRETNLSSLSSGSGSGTAKVPTGKTIDWQALNKQVAASVVSVKVAVQNGVDLGSGAIIDKDGNIVTNNHVIEGAQSIQVTLNNGKVYTAKLVGTDKTTDLAVIRLENPPKDLQPAQFANSDELAVGQQIMAIGNPLGYENTATTGIVSALNRPVAVSDENSNSEIVTNAIQIDAAINPGNSGGPTFDAAGKIIGINSSIATASQSSQSSGGSIGIGFAIPANLVKRVASEIIKDGHATHVQLGVTISDGSAEVDGATVEGAKVVKVLTGSVGQKAGLQTGDVIVGFNGKSVSSMYSVLGSVRATALNAQVKLTVVRNGKTLDLNATFDQKEGTLTDNSGSGNNDQNNGNGQNDQNGNNGNGQNNGNNDGNGFGNGLIDPFGLFGGSGF